jgi:hypothetical protein
MDYSDVNKGTLFRNEDKADPKDRDYSGSLDCNGVAYWISGYIRTSNKTGKKFLSLKIKPKIETTSEKKSPADDLDEEIDF